MDDKLLESICEDKDFLQSLVQLQDDDDIKKAFTEKGLELSDDDVKIFKASVVGAMENDNQIPEEVLEEVSGGKSSWIGENWHKLVYATSAVAVAGAGIWAVKTLVPKFSGVADDTSGLMKDASGACKEFGGVAKDAKGLVGKKGPVAGALNTVSDQVKKDGLKGIVKVNVFGGKNE